MELPDQWLGRVYILIYIDKSFFIDVMSNCASARTVYMKVLPYNFTT